MNNATLRAARSRFVAELRSFVREPAAVGFTVLLPVMLLMLFASIFGGDVGDTGVSYSQVYVASIVASSILSVGFVSLAIGITTEREAGALKRLAGTPMPKVSYFLGKIGFVIVVGLVEIALMIGIGATLYDLRLPTDVGRWFTFAWVFGLGAASATLLGVAAGGLIGSSKAAPAVLNVPFVALQFISGVFIPDDDLPAGLRSIASWFPLRWLCKGMRSVFLPDGYLGVEPGGAWQHPRTAIVLAAWSVAGLVLARLTFRWVGRER